MNCFIFNPQSKRARLKGKIANYLTHLGVEGEMIEVKDEKMVGEAVKEAVSKGAESVIAIGGDGVVNRVIQVLAKTETSMGIIPIGETNFFANMLGISDWKKGCEALTQKKTLDVNLGIISGEKYFTSSIEIEGKNEKKEGFWEKIFKKSKKKYYPVTIQVEDENSKFKIQTNMSSILITTVALPLADNFNLENELEDQRLNIIIQSKPNQENKKSMDVTSSIKGKKIEIESKSGVSIKADGENSGKASVKIEMMPKCLKAIVAEK